MLIRAFSCHGNNTLCAFARVVYKLEFRTFENARDKLRVYVDALTAVCQASAHTLYKTYIHTTSCLSFTTLNTLRARIKFQSLNTFTALYIRVYIYVIYIYFDRFDTV